jgi:hypothetical protein
MLGVVNCISTFNKIGDWHTKKQLFQMFVWKNNRFEGIESDEDENQNTMTKA